MNKTHYHRGFALLGKRYAQVILLAIASAIPSVVTAEADPAEGKERPRELPSPPRFQPEDRPGAKDKEMQSINKQKRDELAVIEQFLQMPPEKLAMIRSIIEKLEAMTPEERQEMRQRIQKYRQLNVKKRQNLIKDFKRIPVAERYAMRAYWQSLSPEEAEAEKAKLKSMTPEERKKYRTEILKIVQEKGLTARERRGPNGMRKPKRQKGPPPVKTTPISDSAEQVPTEEEPAQ